MAGRDQDFEAGRAVKAFLYTVDESGDDRPVRGDFDGRVFISPYGLTGKVGPVLTVRKVTSGNSTTKLTLVTPRSKTQLLVLSVRLVTGSTTGAMFELYFGGGTNITTNAGKEIDNAWLETDGVPSSFASFEPAGLLGALGDEITYRTSVNITTNGYFLVRYREVG